MAFTTIPIAEVPVIPAGSSTAPTIAQGATIDASGEMAAWVFRAPKTGDIAKVHWRTRSVATGDTVDVRIETVDDTTGFPTGTLWDTTTNGAHVVGNGDDNIRLETTLTSVAGVTAGEWLAVVIVNGSAPGNIQMGQFASSNNVDLDSIYGANFTTAWAVDGRGPIIAVEYDDGSIPKIFGAYPPPESDNISIPFNNTSTPDSVGGRFKFAAPVRVSGCWVWMDLDGDAVVKLVSEAYHQANATGILASVTLDKDIRRGNPSPWRLNFSSAVELSANTYYRLIVEPTSATNMTVYEWRFGSEALLGAFSGDADVMHLTTAKDPTGNADWTNYDSSDYRGFWGGLIIDGIDDGVGGGGGTTIAGTAYVIGG